MFSTTALQTDIIVSHRKCLVVCSILHCFFPFSAQLFAFDYSCVGFLPFVKHWFTCSTLYHTSFLFSSATFHCCVCMFSMCITTATLSGCKAGRDKVCLWNTTEGISDEAPAQATPLIHTLALHNNTVNICMRPMLVLCAHSQVWPTIKPVFQEIGKTATVCHHALNSLNWKLEKLVLTIQLLVRTGDRADDSFTLCSFVRWRNLSLCEMLTWQQTALLTVTGNGSVLWV